ncbi:2-polyprenyl-6-methoxyphenol hydroxylase [Lentzea waywayandensis]|uniref:2-polyprenyl-6-methoxyphenol hydroxylase n=1 Tax=Lentzea waywayandensis TaxID=84724 RepID=A0A1I6FII8_9PSEU|nr:FAD-dependent oxidoreductase [Lentzea waywayandensis]SFR29763.1 2-polyprenyl-6-methoxyphenol hydroxylase [Lentzea waywayandensis]
MPKSNAQQRVLIVGAGIAGLATAWWLERAGWDVLVVEKAPSFRAGGYMIDFFGPGHEVARRMGLLPALERRRAPISSVTSVDSAGRRRSEISTAAYEAVADGVISLLRGDLASVIRDDLRAEIRYGTTVSAIDDGRVTFSDGSADEFDLVVGADGVHSRVRELVFGSSFVRYLGHHVAAFSVHDPALSARIGYRYQMLTVPHRMIGCYAVRDGSMAALMLYRSASPELPADPATELRSRFGDLGWVAPSLLSVVPEDVYYDEVSQVDMPVWHRGKVVLVGDACGAVSLFAGHGASLAMTGACVLAEELAAGLDGAFDRYQARMKPAVEHTQEFGRRFIGWMAPSSAWRISLRDLAFRLSGLPVVRNLIRGSVMPDVDGVLTPAAPAGTAA